MSLIERLRALMLDRRGEVAAGAPPASDTSSASGDDPANSGDSSGANPGDDDGGSWLDILPEEAQADEHVKKYKSPDEFYKAFKSQSELIGRKGLIPPKEGAAPEEVEAFRQEAFKALGRPDTAEGYKLQAPEGMHESIQINEELAKTFNDTAHKLGLNNEQANGINQHMMSVLNQAVVAEEKRSIEAAQAAETALRQEWGEKFEGNKNLVAKGILKFGGEEALEAMGGPEGLGNNPHVLKAIGGMMALLGEDTVSDIINQGPKHSGEVGSREEAKAAIKAIEEDSEGEAYKALMNERDPKHKEVVDQRKKLYQIAYGDA